MKLIIGLGNPGEEYQNTRHNIGFATIDYLLLTINSFDNWKYDKKSNAEIAKGEIVGQKVILAKPQTFMNLSGETVKKMVHDTRSTLHDILVIHDDLDLELGTIKLSYGSGSAGHNGVQSIIDHLKTEDFWRLRVGIGPRPQTPSLKIREGRESYDKVSKFVLKPLSRLEQAKLKKIIKLAGSTIELILEQGPERAQTEINKSG